MGIKRHKPEEIVSKLRQVDVLVGQGMSRPDAIRQISITEQTYYFLDLQRSFMHCRFQPNPAVRLPSDEGPLRAPKPELRGLASWSRKRSLATTRSEVEKGTKPKFRGDVELLNYTSCKAIVVLEDPETEA